MHTRVLRSAQTALGLSLERASSRQTEGQAVASLLVEWGANPEKVNFGFGSGDVVEITKTGRQQGRRAGSLVLARSG